MTIKNFLSGILVIIIILCVIAMIIGLPIGVGIFVHNVVYDVTDPSSHMEKIRSEPIIQEIKYDVFAEDLENKFVEIEGVGFGGAGAGGLGLAQASVSKEEFINQTNDKVFYSEEIIEIGRSKAFVQTYWTLNGNILLEYKKVYTPPFPYTLEKGDNELIYQLYNPSGWIATLCGIIAGIVLLVAIVIAIGRS